MTPEQQKEYDELYKTTARYSFEQLGTAFANFRTALFTPFMSKNGQRLIIVWGIGLLILICYDLWM